MELWLIEQHWAINPDFARKQCGADMLFFRFIGTQIILLLAAAKVAEQAALKLYFPCHSNITFIALIRQNRYNKKYIHKNISLLYEYYSPS